MMHPDDYSYIQRPTYSTSPLARYAVILQYDEEPSEPEHEGGAPIWRKERGVVEFTGYGANPSLQRHYQDLEIAMDRVPLHVFRRWVRAFHDGEVKFEGRSGVTYIGVVTRTIARFWGLARDVVTHDVDMTEWMAYVDGEVFGYTVLRRESLCGCADCDDGWEVVASCFGFYGDTHYAETEGLAEARHLRERDTATFVATEGAA